MDKNYVFFEEKGVNWDSVHSVYFPRTRNLTDKDYIPVFQELISIFKDGHLCIETTDRMINYELPFSVVDSFSSGGAPQQYFYEPILQTSNKMFWGLQLKENIAYIEIATFNETFDYKKFDSVINRFSCSNGIILDVRSNSGGMSVGVVDLAACFFTENRTLWYQRGKTGAGHNDFSDYYSISAKGFGFVDKNIPVVLLTGGRTYSAANYFAGIMKYLPNVTVIGTKTGGGGSARTATIMPNGWKLYYPYTPACDIQMNSLEKGVEPHIKIEATKAELQENPHLVFETAYNYLLRNVK
ncbi:peptidase S41 [Bacteroidia bacterium]|nr:peptidase S41 [Bacteroidia bacterium]